TPRTSPFFTSFPRDRERQSDNGTARPCAERQCLAVVDSVHAGWPCASVTSAHADSIIWTTSLGIGTYCNSSASLAPGRYDQSKNLSISTAVSRVRCCL